MMRFAPWMVLLSLAGCGVAVGPPPAQRHPPPAPVQAGQTVAGRLERGDPVAQDTTLYDEYAIQAAAGERLVITLRSADFDAFLAWGRGAGGEWRQEEGDDDGGGGTDSRPLVTVPQSGTYVIRANALTAGESGAYALTVSRAP